MDTPGLRAHDAQGTPTQGDKSPSVLVCEDYIEAKIADFALKVAQKGVLR